MRKSRTYQQVKLYPMAQRNHLKTPIWGPFSIKSAMKGFWVLAYCLMISDIRCIG